jgi:hypothetical protein
MIYTISWLLLKYCFKFQQKLQHDPVMNQHVEEHKSPQRDELLKKMWYTHTQKFIMIKKLNAVICNNMDEYGWLYTKWNKPCTEW